MQLQWAMHGNSKFLPNMRIDDDINGLLSVRRLCMDGFSMRGNVRHTHMSFWMGEEHQC